MNGCPNPHARLTIDTQILHQTETKLNTANNNNVNPTIMVTQTNTINFLAKQYSQTNQNVMCWPGNKKYIRNKNVRKLMLA